MNQDNIAGQSKDEDTIKEKLSKIGQVNHSRDGGSKNIEQFLSELQEKVKKWHQLKFC